MHSRRFDGHAIRMDVLISALRKGIRRGDHHLALWSGALLARGGYWTFVVKHIFTALSEDSNCITEPMIRGRLEILGNQLLPHLNKKGFSKNTPAARRLLFDLLLEAVEATKSRLVSNAIDFALQEISKDIKFLQQEFETHNITGIQDTVFHEFKLAYQESDRTKCLKYTMLAVLLDSVSPGILERLWKYILKIGPNLCVSHDPEQINRLWSASHAMKTEKDCLGNPTLALFESILLRFFPPRGLQEHEPNDPSQRLTLHNRSQLTEFWNNMFECELKPNTRMIIPWEKWISIVLDCTTASGKGQNTLAELKKLYPDWPSEFEYPDHSGFVRVSHISHYYTIGCALENQMLHDPFVDNVKSFYWDIERGRSLACFGQGVLNANREHIKSALVGVLFHDVFIPETITETSQTPRTQRASRSPRISRSRTPKPKNQTRTPRTPKTPRTPIRRPDALESVSGIRKSRKSHDSSSHNSHNRRRSRSALQIRGLKSPELPSFSTKPFSSVSASASALASTASLALPGMHGDHNDLDANHGPVILENNAVSFCQMIKVPDIGKPASWIVVLENGRSYWIKPFSEIDSTIPIYFDKIKPKFGLPNIDMRWSENWLIARDLGSGGPYKLVESGKKKWQVIDPDSTGISKSLWSLSDATKILLFRALFCIDGTVGYSILFNYSVKEYSLKREFKVDPKTTPVPETVLQKVDLIADIVLVPEEDLTFVQNFKEHWSDPGNRKNILHLLMQWERAVFEIPMPHRPIKNFPEFQVFYERILFLKALFTD